MKLTSWLARWWLLLFLRWGALFWFFLLLCANAANAQTFGKKVIKVVIIHSDSTFLDSFSIAQDGFKVEGLNPEDFQIDFARALLVVNPENISFPKEITVEYLTFPFNFSKPVQHKSTDLVLPSQRVYNPFVSTGTDNPNDILDLGDIEKRGSISRGVSVGNGQNLSVNSSLNLQLNGKLNERFSLVAAITDQNIPIQPEGNTQQLQDFDQVYLQVYDDKTRITAGDFQSARNDEGYFMQFNKKLQGGRIESVMLPFKGDTSKVLSLEGSGAVSRGKFARKTIQGVEGNQGPYRLTGEDGEPFIVVLSGTERVYLDGRLLSRGQENDYIINYNTAEITFTAKMPITKDRRIVAEYQYSDRNYARSMIYGAADFNAKKLKLNVGIYSEQDAKNQSLQQELNDEQKDVLRSIGDSLNKAVASSIDTASFSENRLLYELVDTFLVSENSGDTVFFNSILQYSSSQKDQLYQATFSNVGLGNGDYNQAAQLALGRVYEWVAPIDGQSQGSYAPVIQLVTPKQQQMATISAAYQLTKNIETSVEFAASSNDINTFSPLNNSDNTGLGVKAIIKGFQPLKNDWRAVGALDYEFVHRNFNQVERFRGVEFDRDWNIRNLNIQDHQSIIGARLGFEKKNQISAIYGVKSFSAGNAFNGLENGIELKSDLKRLIGSYNGSIINQQGNLINSQFIQHNTNLKVPIWKLNIGYRDDLEENLRLDPQSDSLTNLAYRFWEWETFITNSDTAENKYKLSYAERTDWLYDTTQLSKATFARIYGFENSINSITNSVFNFRINYRTLEVLNQEITQQERENTLLSRIEYQGRFFKGAITTNTFYEIGSGLENRREYIFIETTPGQGTHIFIDYNDNGEKELSEFEQAIQADQIASANYIKVFVPTNDYIKVFTNQFSQALSLRPSSIWRGKKGLKKIVSHFSDQFSYSADRKNLETNLLDQFNPFAFNIADSILQSTNSNFRNIFYFNQSNPVFGADINYQRVSGRNLLTTGFEERQTERLSTGFRWNFTQVLSLEARAEQGTKSSGSDASILSSRNYTIDYQQIEPKLTLQPGTKWRLSYSFNFKEQQNTLENLNPLIGNERAISRKHLMEFNLSSPEKGSLLANASLIQISYNGNATSAVGFELLDGLQPGLNATWGIGYQRVLANNLQISINYNGRQSPGINMIHTGGIEARAFF
jgi:hypothetical protein